MNRIKILGTLRERYKTGSHTLLEVELNNKGSILLKTKEDNEDLEVGSKIASTSSCQFFVEKGKILVNINYPVVPNKDSELKFGYGEGRLGTKPRSFFHPYHKKMVSETSIFIAGGWLNLRVNEDTGISRLDLAYRDKSKLFKFEYARLHLQEKSDKKGNISYEHWMVV